MEVTVRSGEGPQDSGIRVQLRGGSWSCTVPHGQPEANSASGWEVSQKSQEEEETGSIKLADAGSGSEFRYSVVRRSFWVWAWSVSTRENERAAGVRTALCRVREGLCGVKGELCGERRGL